MIFLEDPLVVLKKLEHDEFDHFNLPMPDWNVELHEKGEIEVENVGMKEVHVLKSYITFNRITSNEILHTFLPTIMLSIASSCSVFLSPDLLTTRMSLCVTSFLSMIAVFKGAK